MGPLKSSNYKLNFTLLPFSRLELVIWLNELPYLTSMNYWTVKNQIHDASGHHVFISMRASAVLINGSLSVLILPEVEDKFPIKF